MSSGLSFIETALKEVSKRETLQTDEFCAASLVKTRSFYTTGSLRQYNEISTHVLARGNQHFRAMFELFSQLQDIREWFR